MTTGKTKFILCAAFLLSFALLTSLTTPSYGISNSNRAKEILDKTGDAFPPPSYGISNSERAKLILDKTDDMWRGTSSFGRFTMNIKTKHYERSLTMEGYSLGKDYSLIKILKPLKEKNTITLKSVNSIYTYLPKTDRTIRLTSSMMTSSWMGSHLTNDDLIKESRLSEDYDFDITDENKNTIEITLTPKEDAAIIWGKIVLTVRAKDYIPLTSKNYDEDMVLARITTFSNIQIMDKRLIPLTLKVVPTDKENEYTEFNYELLDFDINIDEDFFSLTNLKARTR